MKHLKGLKTLIIIMGALALMAGAFAPQGKARAAEKGTVQTAASIAESKQTVKDEAAETDSDEEVSSGNEVSAKAYGAAIAIGLAALGGAIAMGNAIGKSADGIARQPEADGKIRSALMIGLVFIETAIIYALIVAILIIFVL